MRISERLSKSPHSHRPAHLLNDLSSVYKPIHGHHAALADGCGQLGSVGVEAFFLDDDGRQLMRIQAIRIRSEMRAMPRSAGEAGKRCLVYISGSPELGVSGVAHRDVQPQ